MNWLGSWFTDDRPEWEKRLEEAYWTTFEDIGMEREEVAALLKKLQDHGILE